MTDTKARPIASDRGAADVAEDAPAPPGVALSAEQLAYEKFLFEKRIALREIELKEKEATRLARESARSRWTNLFIVAVIGVLLVGLGNAFVSILNGEFQRNIAT